MEFASPIEHVLYNAAAWLLAGVIWHYTAMATKPRVVYDMLEQA